MKRFSRLLALAGAAALVTGSAYASGFAIQEQSVSGLGNAFAGSAAIAEDASTIFFNPAGITKLKGHNASVGLHYIIPSVEFNDGGSTNALGQPMTGGDGGDGGEGTPVPSAYYSYNMGDVSIGLGVYAPFGLKTEYDDGWVGRYYALTSEMKTVNISPTVAIQLDDHLSVGFSLGIQHLEATLSKAVDWGTKAYVGSGMLLPPTVISNPAFDVTSELEADGWAYGFTLGFIFETSESTRIGLNYRSRYEYDLEGDADFSDPALTGVPALDGLAAVAFADTDASTDITLPDVVSLSVFHQLTPSFQLLFDASYTNWSVLDELKISFANGNPDSVETFDWQDTWKVSLGANYQLSDKLLLRCGVAFDESPVPGAADRTPRVPDEDRTWFSFGAGYDLSKSSSIDAAFTHIMLDEAKVNNTSAGLLLGDFDYSVNIISVQGNFAF